MLVRQRKQTYGHRGGWVELGGEEGGTNGESSVETHSGICRIASHGEFAV